MGKMASFWRDLSQSFSLYIIKTIQRITPIIPISMSAYITALSEPISVVSNTILKVTEILGFSALLL